MTAKPLPFSVEELREFEQFCHICAETEINNGADEVIAQLGRDGQRALATIRRRDELIRWLRNHCPANLHLLESHQCQTEEGRQIIRELIAIVEAGDG